MDDHGGVLLRKDCPQWATSLDWLAARGILHAVLPATYTRPELAMDVDLRMLAARRWAPDGVLRGTVAARLTFWPEIEVTDVAYSVRTRQVRRDGYQLDRRAVSPDLVLERGGWRCTTAPLTVLDLVPQLGGDVIDQALRSRHVTVEHLRDTLAATSNRPGNRQRLQLLVDSRAEPWSAAERLAHTILHRAGVQGWVANHEVRPPGQLYYLDIAFVAQRLAIEIDGRKFHDAARFESDRIRHNELTMAGWTVLHVTWAMLQDPDAFLLLVERTLETCTR